MAAPRCGHRGDYDNHLNRSLFANRITGAWETVKTEDRRTAYNTSLAAKESELRRKTDTNTVTSIVKKPSPIYAGSRRAKRSTKQLIIQRVEPEGFWSRASSLAKGGQMSKSHGRKQPSYASAIARRVARRCEGLTAHPLRAGAVGFLTFVAFWVIFTKSLPYALAPTQPDVALALNPNNPVALLAEAEELRAKLVALTGIKAEKPNGGEGESHEPRANDTLAIAGSAVSGRWERTFRRAGNLTRGDPWSRSTSACK